MLKSEREEQIINILRQSGYVSVKTLSKMLFASESSIRRDLADLDKKGFVNRNYGGAELITANTNVLPFYTRAFNNVEEKKIIATKAAGLIKEGSTVFLDQSSTSFFLAREIYNRSNITVITNNTEILSYLSQYDITLHASGGVLSRQNRNCLIGKNAQRTFENIYADICFFSANSLSEDGVISDCTEEEVFVRNSMIENADLKVFLCNSEKIGTHSIYKQCSLVDIDCLITENESATVYRQMFPELKTI